MKKRFDCVAMKDRIQKRLLSQMEGLSVEERGVEIRETLDRSASPIGALWRTLRDVSHKKVSRVAEPGAAYDIAATRGAKRNIR